MADPIRCVYAMDEGYFCTKHSNAFYDASCRLLDGESCEDQKPSMPITNADRIRGMTDEELADEILGWFNWLNAVEWNDKRILDWLKEEVSDAL